MPRILERRRRADDVLSAVRLAEKLSVLRSSRFIIINPLIDYAQSDNYAVLIDFRGNRIITRQVLWELDCRGKIAWRCNIR